MAADQAHLQPLPNEIRSKLFGTTSSKKAQNEENYDKFIKASTRKSQDDIEKMSKIVIHLTKTRKKKAEKPLRHTLKRLSYRQRKKLGLYSLEKHSIKYNDILPLHHLWKEYMRENLNLDDIQEKGYTNNPEDPNFETITVKLYRADYHGCELTVTQSACPNYVGVCGIVAMETKNCFRIVCKNDIVKTIPKTPCEFSFMVDQVQFSFFGKNLQAKPADRSSKKMKAFLTSEL